MQVLIAFRPSKEQVCFNFVATVKVHSDLEPKKIKSATVSTVPSSICHEVVGLDAMNVEYFVCV